MMTDYQNQQFNTNQWENKIAGIPKRDRKTISCKAVQKYKLNTPNKQKFTIKKNLN
jgi:hypothetical protein